VVKRQLTAAMSREKTKKVRVTEACELNAEERYDSIRSVLYVRSKTNRQRAN